MNNYDKYKFLKEELKAPRFIDENEEIQWFTTQLYGLYKQSYRLREENKQLKEELEKIKQPTIFIDTQDIEERYGETLYYDFLIEQNIDLQQRIDKAIEYIENTRVDNNYMVQEKYEYLLEILKGSEQ